MLQARLFSYPDTHRHRLGPNYHLLPVNAPKAAVVNSYQRDGAMRLDGNGGAGPNYWPNSLGGPTPDSSFAEPPAAVSGMAARQAYVHPNDDFVQAGNLYRDVMTDVDRDHLTSNIAGHLSGVSWTIQERQVGLFKKADPEYGARVAEKLGLGLGVTK
jgi:catalase